MIFLAHPYFYVSLRQHLPNRGHGSKMEVMVSSLPSSGMSCTKTQYPVSLHGMTCKTKELYGVKGAG